MKHILFFVILCPLLIAQTACSTVAANDRPPNIVILFTDDMGYAGPACYGSTICTTPNLDDLAKRGARFTDFYVTAAVCS